MFTRIVFLAVAALTAATAQTQPTPFRYSANAHAEFNVGSCVHGYAFTGGGGGAEGFVWKGLTAGARVSAGSFSDSGPFTVVLGEVGYHAVDRSRPKGADPFISGGFGFVGGSNTSGPSASLGGGLNYWFNRHVALRLEGRIIGISSDGIVMFQIGAAFR